MIMQLKYVSGLLVGGRGRGEGGEREREREREGRGRRDGGEREGGKKETEGDNAIQSDVRFLTGTTLFGSSFYGTPS